MAKLTLKAIAEMSDEEVYALSTPRPFHPEARGFMFPGKDFLENTEAAECLAVLMKRLGKIKKEKAS
jgi:hypothetical protein